MKKIYKFLAVTFLGVLTLNPVWAQDSHTTDTDRAWYKPDHAVFQFAGNIGMFSAGFGYSYLRDKVTTEFMYGITPSFESNTSIHILTAKNTYHPFNLDIGNGFMVEPFKIGTGISYSIGPQFHTKWPVRYPDGYYWWASSLRFTPYIGATISRKVGNENTAIKRIEFSPELGTHDLALVSYINNENFKFGRILNIAFSTKLVF